jgi:hypothetical protein
LDPSGDTGRAGGSGRLGENGTGEVRAEVAYRTTVTAKRRDTFPVFLLLDIPFGDMM